MTWAWTLILFVETGSWCAEQFVNQLKIYVDIYKYWIKYTSLSQPNIVGQKKEKDKSNYELWNIF